MAIENAKMGFTRKQFDKALRLVNDFQYKADANWQRMMNLSDTRLDIDDTTFRKAASEVAYYNGKASAVSATLYCLGFPLKRVCRTDGTHYWTYETK